MDRSDFSGVVKKVKLSQIEPSGHNPRGSIDFDESFYRLVDSISKVGILVPLVVMRIKDSGNEKLYRLVDGERRYWAAKELGMNFLPAHIIDTDKWDKRTRVLMFHLHMTREQWGPLAQCMSLIEAYPEIRHGIPFDDKDGWINRFSSELGMPKVTARDRVYVLAWPQKLRQRINSFSERNPKTNIYSYVLAIEASLIEPSRKAFPEFYNGTATPDERANGIRAHLYEKLEYGLETGVITNRNQVRALNPLFSKGLSPSQRRTASSLFRKLIRDPVAQFDDLRAEMEARIPKIASVMAIKPSRLINDITALAEILRNYEPGFIETSVSNPRSRGKVRRDLSDALILLIETAKELDADLND